MAEPVNDSTVKGKWNETAGSVKQATGEAFGSEKLANDGAAQQVKGHAQEAWGAIKGTFASDHEATTATTHETADHDAHAVRDDITSAAERVKNSIVAGMDHLKNRD